MSDSFSPLPTDSISPPSAASPPFPGLRAKKRATGLIDHSLSPEAGTGLQGWVLSRLVLGGGHSPWRPQSPGAVSAFYLPLLNCRIHRLLGSTFQSCAFSWILCHLAACRQLCKTAKELSHLVPVSESLELCFQFPFFLSSPAAPQVLFRSFLPSVSLIPTTSFCNSPFKFRTLLTAPPTL